MLQYVRWARLSGDSLGDAATWATEVVQLANEIGDAETSLWIGGPGHPADAYFFSSVLESRQKLAENTAAIVQNEAYIELINRGMSLIQSPPLDILRQVIHLSGTDGTDTPALGTTAVTVTSQVAAGKTTEAFRLGVELSDYMSQLIGVPFAFLDSRADTMGEVAWIALFPTPADLDRMDDLEYSDDGYHQLAAKAPGLFVEGSTRRMHTTKIG